MNKATQPQGFPVEYVRAKGDTKSADPVKFVPGLGTVTFEANPAFDGRAIVFFPDRETVTSFLRANNPPGQHIFVEPPDILSRVEEERIKHLIDQAIKRLMDGPFGQKFSDLEQTVSEMQLSRRRGRPLKDETE